MTTTQYSPEIQALLNQGYTIQDNKIMAPGVEFYSYRDTARKDRDKKSTYVPIEYTFNPETNIITEKITRGLYQPGGGSRHIYIEPYNREVKTYYDTGSPKRDEYYKATGGSNVQKVQLYMSYDYETQKDYTADFGLPARYDTSEINAAKKAGYDNVEEYKKAVEKSKEIPTVQVGDKNYAILGEGSIDFVKQKQTELGEKKTIVLSPEHTQTVVESIGKREVPSESIAKSDIEKGQEEIAKRFGVEKTDVVPISSGLYNKTIDDTYGENTPYKRLKEGETGFSISDKALKQKGIEDIKTFISLPSLPNTKSSTEKIGEKIGIPIKKVAETVTITTKKPSYTTETYKPSEQMTSLEKYYEGYSKRNIATRERQKKVEEFATTATNLPSFMLPNFLKPITKAIIKKPYELTVGFGEALASAADKSIFFAKSLTTPETKESSVVELKASFPKAGQALKQAYDPRTAEGWVNIGLTLGTVKLAGSAAKGGKINRAVMERVYPEKYVKLGDLNIRFVEDYTVPTPLKSLKSLEGTKVGTTHVSLIDPFKGGSSFVTEAKPSSAGGFRSENLLYNLYKSSPEPSGQPRAYLGYAGIMKEAPTISSGKVVIGKPTVRILEFSDVVSPTPKAVGSGSLSRINIWQTRQSGKTFVPAENIKGLSVEGQLISPSSYETISGAAAKGYGTSGSLIVKTSESKIAYYPRTKINPFKDPISKGVWEVFNPSRKKDFVKLEIIPSKTKPVSGSLAESSIVKSSPKLDLVEYGKSYSQGARYIDTPSGFGLGGLFSNASAYQAESVPSFSVSSSASIRSSPTPPDSISSAKTMMSEVKTIPSSTSTKYTELKTPSSTKPSSSVSYPSVTSSTPSTYPSMPAMSSTPSKSSEKSSFIQSKGVSSKPANLSSYPSVTSSAPSTLSSPPSLMSSSKTFSSPKKSSVTSSYPTKTYSSPVSYPSVTSSAPSTLSSPIHSPQPFPSRQPTPSRIPNPYTSPHPSPPTYPYLTPLPQPTPPPIPPTKKRRREYDNFRFGISVRRWGEWKPFAETENIAEALRVGKGYTWSTAGASFKLTPFSMKSREQLMKVKDIGRQYYKSKKEGDVFIEKPEYRIQSYGEKREISLKGVRESKKRRNKRRR